MEEKSYSVQLAEAVKALLDKEEFKYCFREEEGEFTFGLSLRKSQRLQSVNVVIRVLRNALTVYAVPTVGAGESDIRAATEFITRANLGLRAGCFEMDCDCGEVRFKCYNYFGDEIPSDDELLYLISCPGHMWSRYGDSFLKVIVAGVNPKDAVERAERK